MNPLFKYPGGKRRLAPVIDAHRPEGWAVAEPFVGAGAYSLYALGHGAPRAQISDADPRVMMIHQALEHPRFAAEWAARPPIPKNRGAYLALREKVNLLLGQQVSIFTPPILGVLLIQLARTAFNGLWRTNRKGEFNAPSGAFPAFEPSDEDVARVAELYRDQVAPKSARDFEDFSLPEDAPVFVYCDPPYLGVPFTGYGNGKRFGRADHDRLAGWAEAQVRKRPGAVRVVVSNQCSPEDRADLYPEARGWAVYPVVTRRSIGAGIGGAPRVEEFLAVIGGPT